MTLLRSLLNDPDCHFEWYRNFLNFNAILMGWTRQLAPSALPYWAQRGDYHIPHCPIGRNGAITIFRTTLLGATGRLLYSALPYWAQRGDYHIPHYPIGRNGAITIFRTTLLGATGRLPYFALPYWAQRGDYHIPHYPIGRNETIFESNSWKSCAIWTLSFSHICFIYR